MSAGGGIRVGCPVTEKATKVEPTPRRGVVTAADLQSATLGPPSAETVRRMSAETSAVEYLIDELKRRYLPLT